MEFIKVHFNKFFFRDRPFELLREGKLSAVTFRYETDVAGLKISNGHLNMVILPYMGQQIWFLEYEGKALTQKSIFDMPQNTTRFGDNYGGFLLHCGLTNINCAEEGENYPLHGELPFADYQSTYTGIGEDSKGKYLAVGGTYVYRNSQEYFWAYSPELRLYEGTSVAEMHIDIHNRRHSKLDYMFMCHMNWRAVERAHIVYSVKKDREHIKPDPIIPEGNSAYAMKMRNFAAKLMEDPTIMDVLDSENQCCDPELCINMTYEADEMGWGHALQVMPEGDACYVGFRTKELPYALRWLCRTADEDGIGIALPTTGTNRSTRYQKEHGLYNTLDAGAHETIRFDFGYLNKEETLKMSEHIAGILK